MSRLLNIYLISLDKDQERRERMKLNFPIHYLSMKWVSAINGKEMFAKDYFYYVNKYYKKNKKIITPSEVGCALSHIKVYKEFLKTDEKYCLILEDDIMANDNDILQIKKIIEYEKPNGLVLFGGQEGLPEDYFKYIYVEKVNQLYLISEFSKKFIIRTHCYAINREMAKYLIGFHENNLQVADHWKVLLKNKKMYYLNLVKHPLNLSDSNIETERSFFYSNEKNFFKRVKDEGLMLKIYNRIYNDFHSLILSMKGFKRLRDFE